MVVYSDNVGAERGTAKGRAKSWDHTCIVHGLWLKAAAINMGMWIERVPSNDNIADLPSRSDFDLLHRLNAVAVSPVLDDSFFEPSAWRSVVPVRCLVSCSPSVLCRSLEVSTTFK